MNTPEKAAEFIRVKAEVRAAWIFTKYIYRRNLANNNHWPLAPQDYFAGCGWQDWDDFLGLNEKASIFILLKQAVQQEKLNSLDEYSFFRWRHNWPGRPDRLFAGYGWQGWEDFLGTRNRKHSKKENDFRQLKQAVQQLGLTRYSGYTKVHARYGWPSRPDRLYAKDGWQGWGDFLGLLRPRYTRHKTRVDRQKMLSYSQLQQAVLELGITTRLEYNKEVQKHPDWPTQLSIYKEFDNFRNFTQTGRIMITLSNLRTEVRQLGIITKRDYYAAKPQFHRKYNRWPQEPDKAYPDWKNWMDLMGPRYKAHAYKYDFLSYSELKKAVLAAGINSNTLYQVHRMKHNNWPKSPDAYYKRTGEWKGRAEFFKPD